MSEKTIPLKTITFGKINRGKFVISKSRRSWEYEYRAMNGSTQKVMFVMKRSVFSGLTPAILKKEFDWKMDVEVYLYNYDEYLYYDTPRTVLRICIPDIYIDRDPHKVFTTDEAKELCYSVMRETMFEWLERLSTGWKIATANESGAQEFDVVYKPLDEEEPPKKENADGGTTAS